MKHRSLTFLLSTVIALVALGLVFLGSIGSYASSRVDDPYAFVRRQAMWVGVGIVLAIAGAVIPYRFWQQRWYWLLGGSVLLLLLCWAPWIGVEQLGSRRWIKLPGLGFFQLQPSEFARIATVISLAAWFHLYPPRLSDIWRGLFIPLLIAGIPIGLIAMEVDLGSASLLGATVLCMMVMAGVKLRHIGATFLLSAGGLLGVIRMIPNRWGRVMSWWDSTNRAQAMDYQQVAAEYALGAGGLYGQGLGRGIGKSFVPMSYNDFIFSIVGAELGPIASLLTVAAFLLFAVSGNTIGSYAPDFFSKLLGCGLATMISIQALINLCVTTSIAPNKGMPLPFLSYGGSNLMCCLFCVGILTQLYFQGRRHEDEYALVLATAKETVSV